MSDKFERLDTVALQRAEELAELWCKRPSATTSSEASAKMLANAVKTLIVQMIELKAEWAVAMHQCARAEDDRDKLRADLAVLHDRITALTLAPLLPGDVWAELCCIDSDMTAIGAGRAPEPKP